MKSMQEHFVVIGSSFTGCLVVEILSHYFNKVTVIDKEDFNDGLAERKSVLQENQSHILLLKVSRFLIVYFLICVKI